MPALETERLLIRPFALADLPEIHRILDIELADAGFGSEGAKLLDDRRQWLEWTILNYDQLARLYQPPYGERAVALKQGGALLGAVGFVPCLAPFEQLPGLAPAEPDESQGRFTPEFGLYYAIDPARQRQGYATEAARALTDYAFQHLRLKRLVATTTYDNPASMAVMRRLGMRLEHNPRPDPPWLQVVGILDNGLQAA